MRCVDFENAGMPRIFERSLRRLLGSRVEIVLLPAAPVVDSQSLREIALKDLSWLRTEDLLLVTDPVLGMVAALYGKPSWTILNQIPHPFVTPGLEDDLRFCSQMIVMAEQFVGKALRLGAERVRVLGPPIDVEEIPFRTGPPRFKAGCYADERPERDIGWAYWLEEWLGEEFLWLRDMEHGQCMRRLAECEFLVVCSRTESFSYMVAEALAAGVRVVALNHLASYLAHFAPFVQYFGCREELERIFDSSVSSSPLEARSFVERRWGFSRSREAWLQFLTEEGGS